MGSNVFWAAQSSSMGVVGKNDAVHKSEQNLSKQGQRHIHHNWVKPVFNPQKLGGSIRRTSVNLFPWLWIEMLDPNIGCRFSTKSATICGSIGRLMRPWSPYHSFHPLNDNICCYSVVIEAGNWEKKNFVFIHLWKWMITHMFFWGTWTFHSPCASKAFQEGTTTFPHVGILG